MRRNPLPDGSMNLYELTVIGWLQSLDFGASMTAAIDTSH